MFFGAVSIAGSDSRISSSESDTLGSFETSQSRSKGMAGKSSKRRERRATRAMKVNCSMRQQRGVQSDMHFQTMAALYSRPEKASFVIRMRIRGDPGLIEERGRGWGRTVFVLPISAPAHFVRQL